MSPPPCLYDTVIQSYVQLKSGFYGVGRPISWAVLHHWKSMGQLWDAPAPQGCNFYPIAWYVLAQLDSLFKCGDSYVSTKFSLWATTRQSWPHALSMGLLGCFFAPGANIVPPIAYKSHSTPFPIRPHVLTPHSWLCDKNCGRSSAEKKWKKNNTFWQ